MFAWTREGLNYYGVIFASSALTQHIGVHLPNYPLGRRSTNGSCKPFDFYYGLFHISWVVSRFFAHDFDYENLSLRISEGGVLPRRTKNPFIQKVLKKKKQRKTQAPKVEENEVEPSKTSKAEPTPVTKLEARAYEKETTNNPEAEAEAEAPTHGCVERPEHAVEPSEVVGSLEEGVTVEVSLTLLECRWNTHPGSLGAAYARSPCNCTDLSSR